VHDTVEPWRTRTVGKQWQDCEQRINSEQAHGLF
jgi:hypothetical protein